MLSLVLAYLAGVLSVLIVETGVFLFFIRRLVRRWQTRAVFPEAKPDLVSHSSASFLLEKQGKIWVAAMCRSDRHKNPNQQVKGLKEQKARKDSSKQIPEVPPVQKYAKLKDRLLILKDLDGSEEVIKLGGCDVTAVSGGEQASRKWAKRYPIKLENKNQVLAYGSKVCYLYLETAWEKESWCKALRLSSRTDIGRSDPGGAEWYCKLKKEFEQYFSLVNEVYPSSPKLNLDFSNQKDRNVKSVVASSKVRHLWKKLARKTPKIGNEAKTNIIPASIQEGKKISNKGDVDWDSFTLTDFSSKGESAEKNNDNPLHTESTLSSSSAFGSFGNQNQSIGVSDIDSEKSFLADIDADNERGILDQGTLGCNLLFSRLFFDASKSPEVIAHVQAVIQRLLSKVRTPSYVGGINCTRVDPGMLPPHICNTRVLPASIGEAWALEVDIEYSGGALMDIETRLEVGESQIAMEVTTGFLNKEYESRGEQLQLVRNTLENKDEVETSDGTKNSSIASWRSSLSSWKEKLSHFAGQVSQVPLALSIRVSSLKGTVRISIKPPPSDCIWFGFTSEPNIEWAFEPSIGDHKITSGPVATLIASRIKAAIRETLVLPNCETIYIPWMQADKNDWIPQRIAPVPWIRQESSDDNSFKQWHESLRIKDDGRVSLEDQKSGTNKHSKDDETHANNASNLASESVLGVHSQEQSRYHAEASSHPTATKSSFHNGRDDLMSPLLGKYELQNKDGSEIETALTDPSLNIDKSLFSIDGKSKKGLKRTKMIDLGKKVGNKLEEKRRHIEEKSRHIVEKMRGGEKNEGSGSES